MGKIPFELSNYQLGTFTSLIKTVFGIIVTQYVISITFSVELLKNAAKLF